MQTFEMGLSRSISITALGLLATTACDTSRSILAPPPATAVRAALTRDTNHPVKLGAVTFAPNLLMVTAAVAHVECSGTITALQVSYHSPQGDAGATPRVSVSSCPVELNVLGLLPS